MRVTARYAPKIHAVAMSLWRLANTDADAAEALADRMRRRRVARGRWIHLSAALARYLDGDRAARAIGQADQTPDPDLFRAQVADMAAQSEAMGATFLAFTLVPHVFAGQVCEAPEAFCARHRAWAETEAAILAALRVPVIPAEPILDAAGAESYFAADKNDAEHPSPEGHRVLGEGFAAALPAVLAAAHKP